MFILTQTFEVTTHHFRSISAEGNELAGYGRRVTGVEYSPRKSRTEPCAVADSSGAVPQPPKADQKNC